MITSTISLEVGLLWKMFLAIIKILNYVLADVKPKCDRWNSHTNFVSDKFKECCRKLNVYHAVSSSYNHQSNSQAYHTLNLNTYEVL